jgi:threonine aldolase
MSTLQAEAADRAEAFSNHPAAPARVAKDVTSAVKRSRNFASDNASGVCPEAWAAMAEANAAGHCPSYGADAYTQKASDAFRELFETDCDVYFVFNGTAANSLALASLCQSYHSVVCHETAHVETDECGAPEFYSNGAKLLLCPGPLGKLTPDTVRAVVTKRTDIHYPRPRVLSVTQPTELGTTYSLGEVSALSELAHGLGLKVQMDGARFGNGVASLGCSPAALTWKAGVDVLCFGGSKNGMAVGEAVIFFDHKLSEEFAARCKQAGQLASKMRFLAAPWVGMLKDGAWLKHAGRANAMAKRLEAGIERVPAVKIIHPVQANSVFVELPPGVGEKLRGRGWLFYSFIGGGGRLMCSWDTGEADVDALLADLADVATV